MGKRKRGSCDADIGASAPELDTNTSNVSIRDVKADCFEEHEVVDEMLCPLCHELLCEPVVTSCGHTFCHFCFSRVFEVRKPSDAIAVPPSERSRDCPLCRCNISLGEAKPDVALAEAIAKQHPRLCSQRAEDVGKERERLAHQAVEYRKLVLGNTHTLRPGQRSNHHEWTFFVRMAAAEDDSRFIERVILRLHPTFHPSTLILDTPPFHVRRRGWGVFVVTAIVLFKEEWTHDPLVVHWLLDFEGEGSQQEVDLELVKNPQAVMPAQQGAQRAQQGGIPQGANGVMDQEGADVGVMVFAGRGQEDESCDPQEEEESQDCEEVSTGEGCPGGGYLQEEEAEEEDGEGWASDEDLGRLRECAGDYDIGRYRTMYGSPRSSSSEEGPIYDDEEELEGDSEGG